MDDTQTPVRRRGRANRLESLGSRGGAAIKAPALAHQRPPRHLEGRRPLHNVAQIKLDRITPDPGQPRKEFEAEGLRQLAESLKQRQLQPILVRWDAGLEKYVIVSGERRYRASQLAGRDAIDCMVVEGEITESDIRRTQLVENCLREDLKALERAHAFHDLMALNAWNARTLAESLHLHPSSITQALALLDQPEPVQELVAREALSARTAYEIAKLDDPGKQIALAKRVVSEGMSRDQVARAVRQLKGRPVSHRKSKPSPRSASPTTLTYRLPSAAQVVLSINGKATAKELDALKQMLERLGAKPT
jgi:ParB family chromosome partitioning protein